MKITGEVVRRRVAIGSKSEHEAVLLVDASGRSYILRRRGGNPFRDPELDRLVGSRVECEGTVIDDALIATSIVVVPP
jgi:hypothetical protein